MSDVALLNARGSDAKAATEMVANLRKQVEDAERRLIATRAADYETYLAMFERAAILRAALREAETIYGKHFRI